MKVLHLINNLGQGGAERQLGNLLQAQPQTSAVFTLKGAGVMSEDLGALGIPIFSGAPARPLSPAWLRALHRAVTHWQPDIVMGWLYHGNLAASLTARLGHRGPVLWNVRHSLHDLNREKPGTRGVIRAGRWLSRHPARIIYNSATAALQHEDLGFCCERRQIMPNGFDLQRFRPDAAARARLHEQWRIAPGTRVLGIVGRSHPMKNHEGWIAALSRLVQTGHALHCVMVGTGVAAENRPLTRAIRQHGVESQVTLLPPTPEPERLYPGFDWLILPSRWGEGFPNVVGEAMACGVPTVVTDIGDAAKVVDTTGFVAPSPEPEDLARAVELALTLNPESRRRLGQAAHERVRSHYALERVNAGYQQLFREVLPDPAATPS